MRASKRMSVSTQAGQPLTPVVHAQLPEQRASLPHREDKEDWCAWPSLAMENCCTVSQQALSCASVLQEGGRFLPVSEALGPGDALATAPSPISHPEELSFPTHRALKVA